MKKTIMPFVMAFLCMLLLFGCSPKQVENKEVEVVLNGSTRTCLYTGEYLKKPIGVGEYKFTEDGEEWAFKGESGEKSELITGSVEDMPLVIKHDGKKFQTYYTGALVDSKPVDPVQIYDYPYTLKYENLELDGIYTGSIFNDLPDGTGKFNYESKGDYFEYSGNWKAGALSGEGHIDSNCFVIHFSEKDREGEYKGDVIDGIPNGQGTFSAVNTASTSYSYSGAWKDGLFEGYGHLEYDSDDSWVQDGSFKAGEFYPSVADFHVALGSARDRNYVISDSEYDFIESHESFFIGGMEEIDDEFIDKSFKYEEFSKNSSNFELSIIKVSGLRVAQVFEIENFGYKHVRIIAYDSKYRVYYLNMIGTAPLIVEDSRIEIVALPVDFFTYPNVEGTKIWAIACVGIMIRKI